MRSRKNNYMYVEMIPQKEEDEINMKHCGTKKIETERLILRRFTLEDGEAIFENWASDPEVTKFLTWPTHQSVETSKRVVTDWVKGYESNSNYQWAIVLKEEGDRPIGSIAVVRFDEAVSLAHVGYCIGRKWWHKGIMSEALEAVIGYLFDEVRFNRVDARHDSNNPNSGAVMKKCGMVYEGTLRQADINNQGINDTCYYSILRSEWFLKRFGLTKKELSEKIEKALGDYVKVIAKEGNRPYVSNEKIAWVKTDPTAWSNYIIYYKAESTLGNKSLEKEKIDSIIMDEVQLIKQKMMSGELPGEWLIGPMSEPTDLPRYLEEAGFTEKYEMAGMAIDIEHADLTLNIPEGFNVIEVNTDELMETWADIISRGLWNGQPFEACLFQNLKNNSNFKFYLGYFNGEPVSASMLQLANGVADLDLICTLQEHWRKGFGNVMTKMPLIHAREKGYKIGVLQASMAGDHGYRKIGFEEFCRFYVYWLN